VLYILNSELAQLMPEMSDVFRCYKIKETNILDNASKETYDIPYPQSSFFIFWENTYTQHIYLCVLL